METTSHAQNPLFLDTGVVRNILVGFLRDEVGKAGFRNVVLGISGGVDSAVVSALCAEAFGKDHVLGVMMPHASSDPRSGVDARTMIEFLGIKSEVVDITLVVEACVATDREMDKKRRGNIMARQRMTVLYDRSVTHESLVVGTSNKSELLLGYGTQFGDLASALNPIGDLYKTQVWQLAEELGIPPNIIEKKPSADLWAGQTDEDELGFSYKNVDRLLYFMVDERRTPGELEEMGFEKYFIQKVHEMIRRSQFKRQLPVIAKLSHRTINVDFRYARDWGI